MPAPSRPLVRFACLTFLLGAVACSKQKEEPPSQRKVSDESAASASASGSARAAPSAAPAPSAALAAAGYTIPVHEPPKTKKKGKARCRFDWPGGALGKLQVERWVQQSGGKKLTATLAHDFEIAAGVDGARRVTASQPTIVQLDEGTPQDFRNTGLIFLAGFPTFELTPRGMLGKVEAEPMLSKLREMARSQRADAVKSDGTGLLDEILVEGAFKGAFQNTYSGLVPSLNGLPLEFGRAIATKQRMPLPGSSKPILAQITVLPKGRVPCYEKDDKERCVWVEVTTRFDGDMPRPAGAPPPAPGAPQPKMNVEVFWQLVTETASLLPHWLRVRSVTTFTVPTPQGAMPHKQSSSTEYDFHYELESLGR